MDRSRSAWILAAGGAVFIVLELARQTLMSPPPTAGSAADVNAWVTSNLASLRTFPFVDAVAAGGFAVFGISLLARLRRFGNDALVVIGGAAAALVYAISLILDAAISGITASALGGSAAVAPMLVAFGVGVEAMFVYPLALFLATAGWLMVEDGSAALGWAGVLIGVAFLASGLLRAMNVNLELAGPLFMALLAWIAIVSIAMVRRERIPASVAAPAATA